MHLTHADSNKLLELRYAKHKVQDIDANTSLNSIVLKDPLYPV